MRFVLFPALLLCFGMAYGEQARIEVHGHRGARARFPENTMPAFEYAIAQGVDVLELDLGVTKDNILVVSHDSFLKPPICTGPKPEANIRDLTLKEIREWDCGAVRNPNFPDQKMVKGTRMPTLDEVFGLASKGKFRFNIETKIEPDKPKLTPEPDEFAKLVVAAIRKHHLESRVIVQSFDFRTLIAMKRLAPEIQLSALYTGEPKSFVEIAHAAGATIVSPEYRLVTAEQVRAAHAAGLKVVPWTANAPADWARLIAAGVDGIITDDPAALIAHLR
ncbi:MAG: glycerophosphodiester phosphodiesterase [Acidobacteriota bacterium]